MADFGVLYIVATPIGNLEDITLRALTVLREVSVIAAEDTRHSQRLLSHYGIKKLLISLHDFNEEQKSEQLLQRLQQGENVALISDAGTPLISDPGYRLVTFVRAAGITVTPVPGACAAICALSASGLPTDKFVFEGFLPAKNAARCKRLQELVNETRTLIFYESPHRLLALLQDLVQIFGAARQVVIAKELTKMFETIYAASVADLYEWVSADANRQKGEFVLLVHGAEPKQQEVSAEALRILQILAAELSHKQAVSLAAKITGESKNLLYRMGSSSDNGQRY